MNCSMSVESEASTKDATHQKGLGEGQYLVLGQIPIFVLVVKIEEPFNVLHEVVEHDTIQA